MRPKRARLVVPGIDPQCRTLRIVGAELQHLRVRRVRQGDLVTLLDASGGEYLGVVTRLAARFAEVELRGTCPTGSEPPLRFIVCVAAARAPRLDFAIEKATELGAAEIVVFLSERTVCSPPPDRQERWRRVAASAAKQSGRMRIPETLGPLSFPDLLQRLDQSGTPALLFHPGAPPLSRVRPQAAGSAGVLAVIVGPEGGFTDAELERAAAAGCELVGLGPRLLRTETAVVVALAIVGFLCGDLAAPQAR